MSHRCGAYRGLYSILRLYAVMALLACLGCAIYNAIPDLPDRIERADVSACKNVGDGSIEICARVEAEQKKHRPFPRTPSWHP